MAKKPQLVSLKDYMYPTQTTQPSCITLVATNATFEFKSGLIQMLPVISWDGPGEPIPTC